MEYRKLKGRIIEKYGSVRSYCRDFGVSGPAMSCKLNGKTEWTANDILKCCKLLEIDMSSIPEYFFTDEFAKTEMLRE